MSNNKESVERFEQAHAAKIVSLFWIAGSLEESGLKEMLDEVSNDDFERMFPDVYNGGISAEYHAGEELLQGLIDYNKFGFIAEVNFPKCDEFRFENNRPVSWSVHDGVCSVKHVYAETTEELLQEIELQGERHFQYCIRKHKDNE